MPIANSHLQKRPGPRAGWRTAALIYTIGGVVCILASAVVPDSEVGMLVAIAGGLPWSLSLLTLGLSPGVATTALLLLAGSWAVNAALLWWLALRRPKPMALQERREPSHPA
ncbi:hypothetical protein SAMN05216567_101755 [Variovorax sp. OK605]|jgi:hypothetical protein|nr:hypothetical protein SAMN05518853_107263 [Variovorax sp. OK202]SFD49010.1 hypothetical protein SAMN05444746_107263 [Variovorax sp. OK212]SFO62039.1 hypothetical protein SAMN05216567_101755 [Variovorax sp. OK605]